MIYSQNRINIMATKSSKKLTLKDQLSRLTFEQACRILGDDGKSNLIQGSRFEIEPEHYKLTNKYFRLKFPNPDDPKKFEIVEIRLSDTARRRLLVTCTPCDEALLYKGAALSFILEGKSLLGLALLPDESIPFENLDEEALILLALHERFERAKSEKMQIRSNDPKNPWTDYLVTNKESGKTYRVALREMGRGKNYCSCQDFRKNTLGVCKHIIKVQSSAKRKFNASRLKQPYRRENFSVHVNYDEEPCLHLLFPELLDINLKKICEKFKSLEIRSGKEVLELLACIRKLESKEQLVNIYPDAEEFIQQVLHQHHLKKKVESIRKDPASHPLRKTLLKSELLPYQLDGIAFAAGNGRSILADDMGLGKTIQGIGVAELLRIEADIKKVLIVSPASLKSQWASEIYKFSENNCSLILGSADERTLQYRNACFFTICNYEQVLRDYLAIEAVEWDLIILDEGQRIKNWETKTSRIIKSLNSKFALVLTGTPLENRVDDLYSIVEFIDSQRLAPAFRFFNRHRIVDEKGKVIGYKNLAELRDNLKPILLRRTRASVMKELPPRRTKIVRITPTEEQLVLHSANARIVKYILDKAYINEMDLLRLRQAFAMCRMSADSTYLCDKEEPGYSSKLRKLSEILEQMKAEEDRKIIIFSEWTTMLGLIETILKEHDIIYVRLDGSVPQKKRQGLVSEFQKNPDCKVFLATNAGSTGLNLQAANTVINVDLPWNPAVLEQRIGRAHRMGQKRPVQVYILVTEDTIEERLLDTLSAKHELSLASLDFNSKVDEVELSSGIEELKRRLEVLLGAEPHAPVDESRQHQEEEILQQKKQKIAQAGGQMLVAAFDMLNELLPNTEQSDEQMSLSKDIHNSLKTCLDENNNGSPQFTITLPDQTSLSQIAKVLAQLSH